MVTSWNFVNNFPNVWLEIIILSVSIYSFILRWIPFNFIIKNGIINIIMGRNKEMTGDNKLKTIDPTEAAAPATPTPAAPKQATPVAPETK